MPIQPIDQRQSQTQHLSNMSNRLICTKSINNRHKVNHEKKKKQITNHYFFRNTFAFSDTTPYKNTISTSKNKLQARTRENKHPLYSKQKLTQNKTTISGAVTKEI